MKYTNRSVVNPFMQTAHIAIASGKSYRGKYAANLSIVVDRGPTRWRRRVFPLTMINFSPIFGCDTRRPGRLRYSAARQGSVKSLSVAELASNLIDHREALRYARRPARLPGESLGEYATAGRNSSYRPQSGKERTERGLSRVTR